MHEPLFLCQVLLDMPQLFRLGSLRKIPQRTDEYGYLVHSALREALGDAAPQPFCVQPAKGRLLPVLGYASGSAENLREALAARRDSPATDTLQSSRISAKPMPENWRPGTLLRFTTSVCPVERKSGNATDRHRGAELDAYLNSIVDGEETQGSRAEVYQRWFARQVAKRQAAELLSVSVEGFKLVDLVRRTGDRKTRIMRRPKATMSGLLRISDGDAFGDLLRRGLGRHRAFGFGMLLLKSARD